MSLFHFVLSCSLCRRVSFSSASRPLHFLRVFSSRVPFFVSCNPGKGLLFSLPASLLPFLPPFLLSLPTHRPSDCPTVTKLRDGCVPAVAQAAAQTLHLMRKREKAKRERQPTRVAKLLTPKSCRRRGTATSLTSPQDVKIAKLLLQLQRRQSRL